MFVIKGHITRKQALWMWICFSYFLFASSAYAWVCIRPKWEFKNKDDIRFAQIPFYKLNKNSESTDKDIGKFTIGWYQAFFNYAISETDPGILLDRIRSADEVYLNGVKIGGEGKIGDRFVEADKKTRIYRLPRHLLKKNNLLAIRIQSTYIEGGISSKYILLGNYHELLSYAYKKDALVQQKEIFFFGIFVTFLVFCGVLYLIGLRDKEYIYFGLFVLNYALIYLLDSLVFYNTGLKNYFIQKIDIALTLIMPVFFVFLVFSVYRLRIPFVFKIFNGICLCLGIFYLIFPASFKLYKIISFIWSVCILLLIPLLFFYSLKGYIKEPLIEFKPFMIGIWGLILTGGIECINILPFLILPQKEMFHFGFMFFISCVLMSFTMRYMRMYKEVRQLSALILKAQEEERKRLARELHDDLGQTLLSVKLSLQMTFKHLKGAANIQFIKEVIKEVGNSINSLKEIVFNLRPRFLEELGLGNAMEWYIKRMAGRTNVKIRTDIEKDVPVSVHIQEHIFRIFQEAFQNAVKHANASQIEVSLRVEKDFLILSIKDNGCGFDPNKSYKGLGLLSIKERVVLIEGHLHIESKRNKGTRIKIEVPIT